MGRGHLIRAGVAAAVAAAALAAAAAAGPTWHEVAAGVTTQATTHTAKADLALTKAQERTWIGRLSARDRTTVSRISVTKTVLVAAFLDGVPCSTEVAATGVTRQGRTLAVAISYKLPPVGVALCIRSSTPYVVVGVARASLGRVMPNKVSLVLHARS
jgi:hypothetical protein